MDQMLTGSDAYDPSQVTLLLGGWEPYGFAADTKIVIAKVSDLIIPASGTDGDVALALQRNSLGTMTISLMNQSPSNETLCAWAQQMKLTRKVAFPVYMEDPTGFSCETIGWIQSQPDMTIGQEITSVDWVIGLKNAEFARGLGSVSSSFGIANGLNSIKGITV